MTASFWEKTFTSGDIYSVLSASINKNLESQTIAEGGKASDVKIFTDLITPGNLEDLITRNVNNVLQYVNGKTSEFIVYVPVNKIPESLLSKNINTVKTEMSLPELLKEFNVPGISANQIQSISQTGTGSWILYILTSLILVLLFCLLFISEGFGKRLVAPGIALVISGVLALIIAGAGTIIRINWARDLAGSSNMGDSIIGIVAPPVIQGLLSIWLLFGSAAIVLGFILFFVKKPRYNKSK